MQASNGERRGSRDRTEDVGSRVAALLRAVIGPAAPPPANSVVEELILEMARQELQARRERERLFPTILPSDPSWDILLELFIAREEGRLVSAAGICRSLPASEALVLRCIGHLVQVNLVTRASDAGRDPTARLTLTEAARARLGNYFSRTAANGGAAAA